MNSNDLVDRHEVAINSLEFERQVREVQRVTALGWLASRVFVVGDPRCRGGYTGLEAANPNEERVPRYENPLLRSLLGVKRTWPIAVHMSAFDAVDGARSAASKCHRVVVQSKPH
jgi:hypothetical protein